MREGFRAMSMGAPNMNSLVGVGATAAFGLSVAGALTPPVVGEYGIPVNNDFFEEPVLLLAFILLGRALEARARARAASDLRALSTLLPLDATLVVSEPPKKTEGEENGAAAAEWVPMTATVDRLALRPGDLVRVVPGEVIPVDGEVVTGAAAVDEATLTGEPLLVPKSSGDAVSADEALAMGFVNAVVPPEELMSRAFEFAERLQRNAPLAVRAVKEVALRTSGIPLEEAYAIENEVSARVTSSEDAREGPRAFMEKRDPVWTSR